MKTKNMSYHIRYDCITKRGIDIYQGRVLSGSKKGHTFEYPQSKGIYEFWQKMEMHFGGPCYIGG